MGSIGRPEPVDRATLARAEVPVDQAFRRDTTGMVVLNGYGVALCPMVQLVPGIPPPKRRERLRREALPGGKARCPPRDSGRRAGHGIHEQLRGRSALRVRRDSQD